jgi:regulatory protein
MSHRFSPGAARRPAPLDAERLRALAISYVGRYATTRVKLAHYLDRKVAMRGWEGEDAPPIADIVDRCVALGYIDDAAFAAARGAALGRRGYGARRVAQALRAAGIDSEDAAPVEEAAREDALQAALAFAKRHHIGPFSRTDEVNPDQRRRGFFALLRAGHDPELARRVANAVKGSTLDV